MGALFTATYPAMVERLVLFAAMARFSKAPDYPHTPTLERMLQARGRHLGHAGIGADVRAQPRRRCRLLRAHGALPAPDRIAQRDAAPDDGQRPDRRACDPAADAPADAGPAAARRPASCAAAMAATWPTTFRMRCTWSCRARTICLPKATWRPSSMPSTTSPTPLGARGRNADAAASCPPCSSPTSSAPPNWPASWATAPGATCCSASTASPRADRSLSRPRDRHRR